MMCSQYAVDNLWVLYGSRDQYFVLSVIHNVKQLELYNSFSNIDTSMVLFLPTTCLTLFLSHLQVVCTLKHQSSHSQPSNTVHWPYLNYRGLLM
jgi:hypothetical protein